MRAMRQSWLAHRDASEALQLLGGYDRRGQCIEEKLLSGLAKHGENDYLNALENVNHTLAHQSCQLLLEAIICENAN